MTQLYLSVFVCAYRKTIRSVTVVSVRDATGVRVSTLKVCPPSRRPNSLPAVHGNHTSDISPPTHERAPLYSTRLACGDLHLHLCTARTTKRFTFMRYVYPIRRCLLPCTIEGSNGIFFQVARAVLRLVISGATIADHGIFVDETADAPIRGRSIRLTPLQRRGV